jgi:integrase
VVPAAPSANEHRSGPLGGFLRRVINAERALWATALYAGLRLGELRALRWRDVDFNGGVIHVRRSWDAREGEIPPKSEAGKRKVPMPQALRDLLKVRRQVALATAPDALVFGRDAKRPFHPDTPAQRARKTWKAAKLAPLTLHDCRHTYASLMIDAGANAKALSTYMGHANIAITMDRYGHLMPGNEAEAAKAFDVYLAG